MEVVLMHLQRDKKSGILNYRRRFPQDLIRFIPSNSPTGRGRTELKVSLRVADMNAPGAMDRYQEIDREFQEIVNRARKKASGAFDNLDAPTIAYLTAIVTSDGLALDEEVRLVSEPSERKRARARTLKETSADDLVECKELRAVGDIEGIVQMWGDEAASMAEGEGFLVDRTSSSFASLCNAINDAQIATWEGVLRRLEGDLVPTPPQPAPLPISARKATSSKGGSLGLQELFERYAKAPGRSAKTIAQWRPYIAHLAKFIGHDDVLAVTHDNLVAWRNHLRDHETYRGKPLSAKTINGSYLGAASALFAWAKGDGIIPRNPMLEVTKVNLPAKPVTRSKAFTSDEAETILKASLVSSETREGEDLRNAKRWCPWLMAYSGARVNEITQLRKEDIFEQDGVMVMRITPEAGTVKSKSFRLVPLHSHLIEQGFLDFVSTRANGPLFYNPEKRRSDNAINRQSNRLGSKLASWVRSLGVRGVKPNHGWRHYFISQAPRYGIDARATKAITGHAASDVHETYITQYVDVLAKELEKLPRFLKPKGFAGPEETLGDAIDGGVCEAAE